jgi:hypothetical protein
VTRDFTSITVRFRLTNSRVIRDLAAMIVVSDHMTNIPPDDEVE